MQLAAGVKILIYKSNQVIPGSDIPAMTVYSS